MNRLGAWNGLIPRYFVWNDIASCILSSLKDLDKSEATDLQGRSTRDILRARLLMRSDGPFQGVLRHFFERRSFLRLSATYLRKPLASSGPESLSIWETMLSMSVVASMCPPCPKISL